jgi:hypothetical protein
VKPANRKNSVPTGFACINDHRPEYNPEINTDIPLSLSTSNVPASGTSLSRSPLSTNVSSPSSSQSSSSKNSQQLLSETQRVSRSGTQHAPRSSSAPTSRNGITSPILTPLDNGILERLGGPDFDVLYNKMDSSFKSDMKNLLKRTSSIFGSKPIAPPLRGNKKEYPSRDARERCLKCGVCRHN